MILGHADRVAKKTLETIKDVHKELKITGWFLDPLSKFGPDHTTNYKRILDKIDLIDKTFLTTDPKSLPTSTEFFLCKIQVINHLKY